MKDNTSFLQVFLQEGDLSNMCDIQNHIYHTTKHCHHLYPHHTLYRHPHPKEL
uniref:Uncharacterized protein n=1 Tax=Rhizophora mucronata TaxID=61149 RepID=A0A2P2P8J8_RHIMU